VPLGVPELPIGEPWISASTVRTSSAEVIREADEISCLARPALWWCAEEMMTATRLGAWW